MQTVQMSPRSILPLSASILLSLFLSGCAHTEHSHTVPQPAAAVATEAEEEAPILFTPTMAGYMAELGQYMDDVYRFWDSNSMHEVAIQRLDLMIQIHDDCLEIYEDYMDIYDDPAVRSQTEAFKDYLVKSKALTIDLKEAVLSRDDEQIKEAFNNLDMNRRDAHSVFG